jgi:hypothetical protein
MSNEDRCRNGTPNCEFDNEHELALVSELVRVIEQYNKRNRAGPCPACLRDTMLAVAALLHLEAARTNSADADRPSPRARKLGDAFAKAARESIKNVSLAKATMTGSKSRH